MIPCRCGGRSFLVHVFITLSLANFGCQPQPSSKRASDFLDAVSKDGGGTLAIARAIWGNAPP